MFRLTSSYLQALIQLHIHTKMHKIYTLINKTTVKTGTPILSKSTIIPTNTWGYHTRHKIESTISTILLTQILFMYTHTHTHMCVCVCVCVCTYIYKCVFRRWLMWVEICTRDFVSIKQIYVCPHSPSFLHKSRQKCMQSRSYATFSIRNTSSFCSAGDPEGRHGQTATSDTILHS
jgi:hypothetical protein